MEQRDYPLIVQRNLCGDKFIVCLIIFILHRRGTDILLQRFDHRRIIMAQDIQFVVDGMIVEMSGHDIRIHIICRMLYRRKGIDLLPERKHDDTARMLPGASADPRTAKHDTVNLTFAFALSPLDKIILHIAKRRLIRQRPDGSCPIGLASPEYDLRIFMRKTLIISGEIQIDIRLLISLESKECLEGDVEPVLQQRLTAYGTGFIRHVPSTPSGIFSHFLGIKITVMAFLTIIMRT